MNHRAGLCRRGIFQRGVEQVDVDHAAQCAGFFGGVQHFNVIAHAERAHGEDQEGAKQVGQHAPRSKKGHGTHGGKAGKGRPQHTGGDAQALQNQQHRTRNDEPAHYRVDGHEQLMWKFIVSAGALDDAFEQAVQQPGDQHDQQNLQQGDGNLDPVLHPGGKASAQGG